MLVQRRARSVVGERDLVLPCSTDVARSKASLRSSGRVRMHFAIVLAVVPVIFLGEVPDKTMFAPLVLATRGKPLAVWIGAAAAFLGHVVIATTVGVVLFRLVPHRALEAAVAGIFFVGASLSIREAARESKLKSSESKLIEKEVTSHR